MLFDGLKTTEEVEMPRRGKKMTYEDRLAIARRKEKTDRQIAEEKDGRSDDQEVASYQSKRGENGLWPKMGRPNRSIEQLCSCVMYRD